MSPPVTGQVALSASSQPLTTPRASTAFVIKAPAANVHAAFIGPAGVTIGTGYQLDPGDTFEYGQMSQNGGPLLSLAIGDFYVVGTSGDSVSWLVSP